MAKNDYQLTLRLAQSPSEVFKAITQTRGWWSGKIEGDTDRLGVEFSYEVEGVHFSRQKVTELIPNEKVVWHVTDAKLDFVQDGSEWKGTDIIFEIEGKGTETELRFTHRGLAPAFECYANCSSAWSTLVHGNLRKFVETGKPQPSPW